jgi:hypothetical protein
MTENCEIINVFTTTCPTIDCERLSGTGGEADVTVGSEITAGGSTGDNMVLTVIGTS